MQKVLLASMLCSALGACFASCVPGHARAEAGALFGFAHGSAPLTMSLRGNA
jgi:hypothetical protein